MVRSCFNALFINLIIIKPASMLTERCIILSVVGLNADAFIVVMTQIGRIFSTDSD